MKAAIVGYGFMGGMHAQIYNALEGVELVAVVDLNATAARKRLNELGLDIPVYASLEDLLSSEAVDIIDICGPTDTHVELAVAAAKAGKHLFIEKPLALDLAGCARIAQAVEDAGVFAQVGQCIRFWPEYVALKAFIDSGKGGVLKSLSLQRRASRPGYSNKNWLNDETRSGGAAFDLHIHDTDFVNYLFGAPSAVSSRCSEGMSGPDHIYTNYHYEGVAVQAEGGWDYPEHYGFCMAFEAVFENACITYNSASGEPVKLILNNEEPEIMDVEQPGPKESSTGEGNLSSLGGYYNEIEYFVNCLKAGKAPENATIAQASESVRIVIAEIESARSGKTVTL